MYKSKLTFWRQLAITCLLIIVFTPSMAQQISAMSFNIRYDNPGDGENRWDERKEAVCSLIIKNKPDFIGIQEGLKHQVNYIDGVLSDYSYIGVGRDDGDTLGEYSAIFFRNDKFTVEFDSTLWLSETPEKVSVGWDASMERICTLGKFRHNTNAKHIYVFNTHFDHIGEVARRESAKFIVNTINTICISTDPIILCGDFNATPKEEPIKILDNAFSNSRCDQSVVRGPRGTFTGFSPNAKPENRIDFIFTKNIHLDRYIHLKNRRDDTLYISDHLPVFVNGRYK